MEVWASVITALVTAIGTLGAVWYRNRLQKQKEDHQCPISTCVEEDGELLAKIEELRERSNADRAFIFQFHNGGEFYTGKSMQKMSLSYEVVDKGIARILPARQQLPVSACNSTLKPLFEERRYFCYNVEKDYPESLCKFYLTEAGTKSTYMWAIFDLNKKAIGLFGLDYVKTKKKISEEDLDSIQLNVIKMPGYLEQK